MNYKKGKLLDRCPDCDKDVEVEYIPEEPENNVKEDFICVECGKSLK